ncbi:MAG TPA: TlpA disulfide reductase family protein [Bacteroidales bacterium]|nr:TlpA disulfide reductase family protein [Bacteroidales bacterium]HPM87819.1 TlpA disulfide reductase family protein [Bacteroidales bacterium]
MKKIISILMLLSLSGLVYKSVSQAGNYEINGRIEGAEGMKFTLQKNESGKTVILDTITVKDGLFKIVGGPVEYPEMVSLVSPDRKKGFSFFLENAKINITGKIDSLSQARITGSKSNDEYSAFNRSMKPLIEKMTKASLEYKLASEAIMREMKTVQMDFVKNNPGSFVSPVLLRNLTRDMKPEEFESILNAMDPVVAKTPAMAEITAKMSASISVTPGKKAPDFTLNDSEGKPVSLSSKLGTKLLLIDFWAGWCSPCRLENPNLIKVYQEFNKRGFDIIGVSLDRTKDVWVKAIADDKLSWTQVSDLKYFNSPVAKLYNVTAIPANFLLDEKGTIIATNLRGDALYNKIKDILGKM